MVRGRRFKTPVRVQTMRLFSRRKRKARKLRKIKIGIYLIVRDKTIADTLIYIPNDDDDQIYPFCRSQLEVETFGHLTLRTYQLKFNESSKSC